MSNLANFLILAGSLVVMPALTAVLGIRALDRREEVEQPAPMSASEIAAIPRPAIDSSKATVVVLLGADLTEITDALGPYEMFSRAGRFNVVTAAPERQPSLLTGGLTILPHYSLAEIDSMLPGGTGIVVVPNLPNADQAMNRPTIDWIRAQAATGALIHSWCKGAMALAETGLLDGETATAHWGDIATLERRYPRVTWVRGVRWVERGQYVMSAGITSGIDASLRVLIRVAGDSVARRVAGEMRYPNYHFALDPRVEQHELAPSDLILPVNAAWRFTRPTIGLALYDGVGEMDLSTVFDAHGHTMAADVETISATTAPVVSAHGLTLFASTAGSASSVAAMDRIIVPGPDAPAIAKPLVNAIVAGAANKQPEYPHAVAPARFGLEPVIEDLARSADVPTARFALKRMDFRSDDIDFDGPAVPWIPLAWVAALALGGALVRGLVTRPRVPSLVARLALLTMTISCGDAPTQAVGPVDPEVPPVPPAVVSITLDATDVTIEEGEDRQLVATARDASGAVIPGIGISWISNDGATVTVSPLGRISAVRTGTATITASAQGRSAGATVTVGARWPFDLLYTVRTFDIFHEVQRLDMRVAGAVPTRLFTAQQWAWQPRPSPDGSRIAFVCPNPIIGDPAICVADRDGSNSRMIAAFIGEAFQEPAWSSDGTRIAFVRIKNDAVGDRSRIWIVNADGTNAKPLTGETTADQNMPAWSPRLGDGSERIAYVQNVNSKPAIWSVRADGSDARRLGSVADAHDLYPAWSPDGGTIAFQRTTAQISADIWLMDANGTNERPLLVAPLAGAQAAPAWSPDGSLIAFTSRHESGQQVYQVYTAWSDGSRLARRTSDATDKAAPAWLPVNR